MKIAIALLSVLASFTYAGECIYKIDVDIDIEKGLLKGRALLQSEAPKAGLLQSDAKIEEVKNAVLEVGSDKLYLIKKDADKPIEISFAHSFKPVDSDALLLERWYPKPEELCRYETTIKNSQMSIVTEATDVKHQKDATIYRFDHPLDKLNIVASSKYVKDSFSSKNDMSFQTYLYKDDAHLARRYFEKSEEYFSIYKDMFGFAPFKNFAVVEAPFPAGYSMPTFTMIGKQIIGKEFVLDGSLGHEIAHQYFGNYVYAPQKGNWTEGMATYYADYLFAKRRGEGAQYRKDMLLKYDSYVSGEEISLADFQHKALNSKNAIGYEKAAFFFYMLEKKIGKEAFDEGTRMILKEYPFKIASYDDLKKEYEKTSGMKLDAFFDKWVYKKGALDFSISNPELTFVKEKYLLEFDITSNSMVDHLPVSICSKKECLQTKLDLKTKKQRLELDIEPIKIVVDENYETFRKLHPDEVPPAISKIMDGNVLAVIDRSQKEKFSKFAKVFKNFKYADEVKKEELKNSNILVLGSANSLLQQLVIPFEMQGDAKIEVFKNPLNKAYVLAVFDMQKLSKSIFYRLRHLGKYSSVVFEGENISSKSVKPSQNGVVYDIEGGESLALETMPKGLSDVLGDIAKNRVVYIGENHTDFSSHLNQLKIIKAMYRNDPNLSIGMEMFQKEFQSHLDAYIGGEISEKEMLLKTEYFKRWKYDYELYRPILLFAKEKRIPVVALNIDREITKKVVGGGFDSLTKKELSQISRDVDFSDEEYKKGLRGVYSMHHSNGFKNFEDFYHAQLLWDESMAQNMADFLKKNPLRSMAVLAGNGHVMNGSGIPNRAKRRGVADYVIVLNMQNPQDASADYVLLPSTIKTTTAKKLGIYFESEDRLLVSKLIDGSAAKKAKIEPNDIVTAVNGKKVNDIYEIKTELVFTQKSLVLTLLRDGKELEAKVEF